LSVVTNIYIESESTLTLTLLSQIAINRCASWWLSPLSQYILLYSKRIHRHVKLVLSKIWHWFTWHFKCVIHS